MQVVTPTKTHILHTYTDILLFENYFTDHTEIRIPYEIDDILEFHSKNFNIQLNKKNEITQADQAALDYFAYAEKKILDDLLIKTTYIGYIKLSEIIRIILFLLEK